MWWWQAAGDPDKQARGGEGAGTASEAATALQAQADMAPSQPHNPTGLC